jgi:hypothetical protein
VVADDLIEPPRRFRVRVQDAEFGKKPLYIKGQNDAI